MTSTTRVFCAFGTFSLSFTLAFVAPKAMAPSEPGMAGAGSVALTFLGFMLVAAIASIVGFVIAYRRRAILPQSTKLAGYFPLPLLLCTLIYLTVAIMSDVEKKLEEQSATPTEIAP